MIDALDIAVASRNEVQTHIAVADGDRRCRAPLGGKLQPEHGLVELAERVVLVADEGHVIDLGEHRSYRMGDGTCLAAALGIDCPVIYHLPAPIALTRKQF